MAKKKKKRDPWAEIDENGKWVSEKNRILGAMRRGFRLSPHIQIVTQSARVELPPKLKKDGTPGKRNQVRYKCTNCGELFQQKYTAVDHIETVTPLWKTNAEMSYDEIASQIFCKLDNLQVLCSTPMKYNNGEKSCHARKTAEENFIRRYLFKKHDSYKGIPKKEINRLIKEAKVEYKEKLNKSKKKKKVKK